MADVALAFAVREQLPCVVALKDVSRRLDQHIRAEGGESLHGAEIGYA